MLHNNLPDSVEVSQSQAYGHRSTTASSRGSLVITVVRPITAKYTNIIICKFRGLFLPVPWRIAKFLLFIFNRRKAGNRRSGPCYTPLWICLLRLLTRSNQQGYVVPLTPVKVRVTGEV